MMYRKGSCMLIVYNSVCDLDVGDIAKIDMSELRYNLITLPSFRVSLYKVANDCNALFKTKYLKKEDKISIERIA